MIRGVGPYSALITPKAGSLFHAVFHAMNTITSATSSAVPRRPIEKPWRT